MNQAILAADTAASGDFVITLSGPVALTSALDAIDLQPGVTLTVDGQGAAIDGGGTQRGLFVYAGTVTLENLAIDDTAAVGGAGGYEAAGGGAGLGGGLFVAGTNAGLASGGAVTLENVTFSGDAAVGGAGGAGGGTFEGNLGPYGTEGGGGGLGGAGGNFDIAGGGGGGIGGSAGLLPNGDGSPGIVIGAASGGDGSAQQGPATPLIAAGGADGGGGGLGAEDQFGFGGGGGVGGQAGTQTAAGDGGFGGGGGGGSSGDGGEGGFGGGGGSGGGNGGFGGGGASAGGFGGPAIGGEGGFGAGSGASVANSGSLFEAYIGGGGLGAGGAVFVQQGGSLTIEGGSVAGGSATGGAGGAVAGFATPASANGEGLGSGIFLQGNQTLAFSEAAGQSTVIGDAIADQGGASGAGSLSLSGQGTLDLTATNSFAGGITVQGGTLALGAVNAAGSGTIMFAAGASATLQLDDAALPDGDFGNAVAGFAAADAIDLVALGYDSASTAAFDGSALVVTSDGASDTLSLSGVSQGQAFQTAPDGQGGTLVTEAAIAPAVQTIQLAISEDAWQGDAQFTLAVDGTQVGGVFTATALHSLAQEQLFTLQGDFGTGPNTVTVDFLNDAWGGTSSTDRNLYVDSVGSGGVVAQTSTALLTGGPLSFVTPPGAFTQVGDAVPVGTGPDQISLGVSEDQYDGDAQFVVDVNGQQVGGVQTATASHAAGQEQVFDVDGSFGPGPETVSVDFLNDAYAGTAATDRNLYVNTIGAGGVTTAPEAVLYSAGPAYFVAPNGPPVLSPTTIGGGALVFATPVPAAPSAPVATPVTEASGAVSGPAQTIQLAISEDAWHGDAQFTLAVDGTQVGGVFTATALHSLAQEQLFTLQGDFGTGPNTVTVDFLNDAWGGTSSTDRNLYVDSVGSGGVVAQTSTALLTGGPLTFVTPPGAFTQVGDAVPVGTGPDQISLGVSEDQYDGDAQFVVDVNGQQVGGVQTATASHAAGQEQVFDVNGNFGPGPETVSVDFLNDAYAGTPATDRNLYVNTIAAGGVTTAPEAVLYSAGPAYFVAPNGPPVLSPTTIGGGALVFAAPVPAGQVVALNSQTLQLQDAASFQGTIAPVPGSANEADLTGLFGAASLVFSPTAPDAGTLQVLGAGGQALAALQLAGSYGSGDFALLAGGTQAAQIAVTRPGA